MRYCSIEKCRIDRPVRYNATRVMKNMERRHTKEKPMVDKTKGWIIFVVLIIMLGIVGHLETIPY
jgi:hypothetical protein